MISNYNQTNFRKYILEYQICIFEYRVNVIIQKLKLNSYKSTKAISVRFGFTPTKRQPLFTN